MSLASCSTAVALPDDLECISIRADSAPHAALRNVARSAFQRPQGKADPGHDCIPGTLFLLRV